LGYNLATLHCSLLLQLIVAAYYCSLLHQTRIPKIPPALPVPPILKRDGFQVDWADRSDSGNVLMKTVLNKKAIFM
jgi:hypothetical protein